MTKYKTLSDKLCEVIEDYNLVNFVPLNVTSKEKTLNLLKLVDNANGFALVDAPDFREIVLPTK